MRTVDVAGLQIGDDHPPRIMGVLNVSAESPYDPSVFADPGEAARYVDEELIDEGADIVDVGLETANRRYGVLSADEEIERLDVAVEAMESTSGDAVFSIETRYAEVAEAAIERGFDMVNDVCGFADPRMPAVCAEHDVAVVKMASPPDLERPGAIDDTEWTERRSAEWVEQSDYVDRVYEALQQNGFTDETLVDPAFGGWSERKTLADDRETFRRLREFRALGRPILVSINRKNFLRSIADRSTEDALPVSLAATSMAVERGAHVIRTHDVAETRDAALVGAEFAEGRGETGHGRAGPPSGRGGSADRQFRVERLDRTSLRTVTRHLEAAGADPADAAEIVPVALRVTGLDPDQRERLRAAADAVGLRCVGDRQTLVVGARSRLSDLAAELTDSEDLDGLSRTIRASGE